jgi:glycerol-3-phosphate acyltransferase PlsY
MFRPCWVIFREKPSVAVTLGCTIQLSENVLLTVCSAQLCVIIDEKSSLCIRWCLKFFCII